ncbi:hypothetical protein [Bradyrhizobium liaoningense]
MVGMQSADRWPCELIEWEITQAVVLCAVEQQALDSIGAAGCRLNDYAKDDVDPGLARRPGADACQFGSSERATRPFRSARRAEATSPEFAQHILGEAVRELMGSGSWILRKRIPM